MTDAATPNGGRPPGPGEVPRARSAALDLLMEEMGVTFDRWIVLNAVAAEAVPAEVGLLVPALAAALSTTDDTVRSMLDEAESAHHLRVVSHPSGDPAAARVELTAEGEAFHERLRTAIDALTAKLSAGIPRRDSATAGRAVVDIGRGTRAGRDGELGVRSGQ